MTLKEDLAAIPANQGGQKCRLLQAFETRPEDEADIVAALGDLRYSTRALAAALTKNGIEVAGSTVLKHRKNECRACAKAGKRY